MAKATEIVDTKKTETKTEPIDYVAEIGANFNLHNATALFGDNAIKALQIYAQHGGHGVISEDEFKSSLFGGLSAPLEADTTRRAKINDALNALK